MDIEYNRVFVKPDIAEINGQRISFADGTTEEFDVLVGATGYKVYLPFVSPDIVPVTGNHVDLYKRIFVPRWPGLYFIGMLNPVGTLSHIFEEQSRLVARYISGELTLPSRAVMESDIAEKNRRSAAVYTSAPRHEMEEPDFRYVDELHELERAAPARARRGASGPVVVDERLSGHAR